MRSSVPPGSRATRKLHIYPCGFELTHSFPVPPLCAEEMVLLHFGTLMNALAEETKKLARLQAVELERSRLTAALKALPGEIAEADRQLKAAQKRATDA